MVLRWPQKLIDEGLFFIKQTEHSFALLFNRLLGVTGSKCQSQHATWKEELSGTFSAGCGSVYPLTFWAVVKWSGFAPLEVFFFFMVLCKYQI